MPSLIFAFVAALFATAVASSWLATGALSWLPGFIYLFYDSCILMMIARSASQALKKEGGQQGAISVVPSISVLIAGRNEAGVLPACLSALRAQSDVPEEILVIDDGSTDESVAWLTREYQVTFDGDVGTSASWPALRVLRKAHSGKARSLNRALRLADCDVVITLDADTLLDAGAVAAMRKAFSDEPTLAAAGGLLFPRCRRTLWGRYLQFHQGFEYQRGFVGRLAWAHHDALLLVSGAFAAFRRDVLTTLDGFDPDSFVEDYDLIHRLHRWAFEHQVPMKVRVLGRARAVTDAPSAPKPFLQQRTRWFAGFLQTLARNRDMVGNARYGPVGRLMLPIKAMDTLQPLYGLYAFGLLIAMELSSRPFSRIVIGVLLVKYAFDLVFHFYILSLHRRWAGVEWTSKMWLASFTATLTEPFVFQNLRHFGAALGWVAFLRGRIRWAPPAGRGVAPEIQDRTGQRSSTSVKPM